MKRKASVQWQGDLKTGKGTVSTESGVLQETPYSFTARFASGTGTNPEELAAAAHAGCFTMALSAELGKANLAPTLLRTSCVVTLDNVDGGLERHRVAPRRDGQGSRSLAGGLPQGRRSRRDRLPDLEALPDGSSRWTRGSSPSRPNGDQDCGTGAASRTQRKPRWLAAGAHLALAARADHVARAVLLGAEERAAAVDALASRRARRDRTRLAGPRGFLATPGCAASVA